MSAPEDSSTAIRPANEAAAQPESRGDPTVRFTPGHAPGRAVSVAWPLGKGGMGEVYRADDIRLG